VKTDQPVLMSFHAPRPGGPRSNMLVISFQGHITNYGQSRTLNRVSLTYIASGWRRRYRSEFILKRNNSIAQSAKMLESVAADWNRGYKQNGSYVRYASWAT
jgi:hypothetical protein